MDELEEQVKELEKSEKYQNEFVTPKDLVEIMGCSTDHIYKKIRKGYIKIVNLFWSQKELL